MKRFLSTRAAAAIIIANMIGTGVFTSLGFQLESFNSVFEILALWTLGGIIATCGALCYAELGSRFPHTGGEYQFVTKAIHPLAGFLGGWISVAVGFAAPTALVAMAFGAYLNAAIPQINPQIAGISLVLILTIGHIANSHSSSLSQQILTAAKLLLIVLFIGAALTIDTPQTFDTSFALSSLLTSDFAVSLIYVCYAFTGWNTATYVIEELKSPTKSLSKALLGSTALVTLIYLALNFAFLFAAPIDALRGHVEVGHIAASYIFGDDIAVYISLFFAAILMSTASAMTLAGPRALVAMGRDYKALSFFSKLNAAQLPARAIVFQSIVAIGFILTDTFEAVMVVAGATLALSSAMTVLALIVARRKELGNQPLFSTPFYPLPAIIFLGIVFAMLSYALSTRPDALIVMSLIIISGLILYFCASRYESKHQSVQVSANAQ